MIFCNCRSQWISQNLHYNGLVHTLDFFNASTGLACGHETIPQSGGYIYQTTNAGLNWKQRFYSPFIRALVDIQFVNSNVVFACGAENITLDKQNDNENDFESFPEFIRKKYIESGRREFKAEYNAVFLKSENGGVNWQKVSQFDTSKGYMMDIQFFDLNTGYALIDSGSFGKTGFYKTVNGGQNWQFVKKIDGNAAIDEMFFFNMNTGFAIGFLNGGRIYKTTNAGINWQITLMSTQIDGISFSNSTMGIACGFSILTGNSFYKTTNMGDSWNLISIIPGFRLIYDLKSIESTGIFFAAGVKVDSNNLVPEKISTFKTTNFGLNWIVNDFLPINIMTGVALTNQNNFYICGGELNGNALIMKSTNGGNVFVKQTSAEIPEGYLLEQNFPNPFNNSTLINFKCPVNAYLELKIYDVTGKELNSLVNENILAGSYQVRFESGNLPSGVYFYRLNSEIFSETKSFVLIK